MGNCGLFCDYCEIQRKYNKSNIAGDKLHVYVLNIASIAKEIQQVTQKLIGVTQLSCEVYLVEYRYYRKIKQYSYNLSSQKKSDSLISRHLFFFKQKFNHPIISSLILGNGYIKA